VPQNRYLSMSVRETWLSAALIHAHKSTMGPDYFQIRLKLWEKFRLELARHFDSTRDIELYGPLRLDWLTCKIVFYSPREFWRLTGAILNAEDSEIAASLIDEFLTTLSRLDDVSLRDLLQLGLQWSF